MLAHLKNLLAKKISEKTGLQDLDIYKSLEVPKIYDHGHLSWPVFAFAKSQKKNPIEVAKDLQGELSSQIPELESLQAVGGFLNFKFKADALIKTLVESSEKKSLGSSHLGEGKTVVIDYLSPNVAKKMHIGHLRAAAIGQSVRNLAAACGYRVIGVNHLGDWGTQFGRLAWALEKWGPEMGEKAWTIEGLSELYVRFHAEAETQPSLEEEGAKTFLKLESGDPEITKIWKRIIDVSMADFQKMFDLLKIRHDKVIGESFFNDKLQRVVDLLKGKGLLQESQGAQVVMFSDEEKMAPCLIQKSDGASLYATRDLAAALYRHEVLKGDELIYVVGADQNLHFRQVFRVLEMMGYPWAQKCFHVSFGLYRFKEGKMSTRKGRVIHLEDVLELALEFVEKTVNEKNPDLENKQKVIQQIAVGAILFNDLVNDRVKNVEFDWDRALSVEGDSGPYVQYTAVRCKSLLKKASFQWKGLRAHEEWNASEVKLVYSLLQFQEVVKNSYQNLKPNILAQYLLQVCSEFSHFYHENRVLGESPEVESRRLHLVDLSRRILVEGLGLLNIESPDQM